MAKSRQDVVGANCIKSGLFQATYGP